MQKLLFIAIAIFLLVSQIQAQPGAVQFPVNLDTPSSLVEVADRANTTLSATINASVTTITVASTSLFPATGIITIEDERLYYTAKTATTFTVVRGQFSSTAAAHNSGATVRLNIVAQNHIALRSAIIALELKLGTGASVPTTSGHVLRVTGAGATAFGALQESDIPILSQSKITGLVSDLAAKQLLDSDLTAIAGLSPSNDDVIQRKAGVWVNRSLAQLKVDLAFATIATSGSASDLSNGTVPLGRLSGITTNELSATAGITNGQLAGSIAISKLAITGTPNGAKYLRDDGSWQSIAGGGTWGSITGTLSNQTDLQTALDAKFNLTTQATKTSHGFAVLDPIYNDVNGVWQKALATSSSTLPTAIVLSIIDANNFRYTATEGEFSAPSHGLSVGSVYYLQNSGGLGTSPGTVSYVVGAPNSSNVFHYYGVRGGSAGGDALTTNPLSQFAATTSAQLRSVLSDETGTGIAVFATSPTITSPNIDKLSNLTSNGFVKTSGGDGTLIVDTASYVPTSTTVGGAALSANVAATTILDSIGSTRGSVLYRGAGGWTILTPGTSGFVLMSNGSGADPSWAAGGGGSTYDESNPIVDSTANELLKFTRVASAVNELTISNNATGSHPKLLATGGDTNIGIVLEPKGTGGVSVYSANGAKGLVIDSGSYGNPFTSTYRMEISANFGNVTFSKYGGQDVTFSGAGSNTRYTTDIYGYFENRRALYFAQFTPAQFTANQNDLNYATNWERQPIWRLSSDASRDITGLNPSNLSNGSFHWINVGSNDIVIKHESASSAAANRFVTTTGADLTLSPNKMAWLWYDATSSRWRIVLLP